MATDGNTPTTTEAVEAQIKDLNAKARAGDVDARAKLKSFLDGHPDVWRRHGDLALFAQAAWFRLTAEQDPFRNECLVRAAAARRAELSRPDAPPAERLLVERAVACRVQVDFFSMREAVAIQEKEPPRLLEYWAKRHVRAQRSFEAALAAVVNIQKLLPAPVVPEASAGPATKAAAEPAATPPAKQARRPRKAEPAAKVAAEPVAKVAAERSATPAPKQARWPRKAGPAAKVAAERSATPAPKQARRPRKAGPAAAPAVEVADRIENYLNSHAEGPAERLVGVH